MSARPRHLAPVPATPPAPAPMLVTMTEVDLRRVVRDEVLSALAAVGRDATEPPSEWLDAEQAAAAVQVSSRTMRNLASSGELPATRVGRQWRFLRADLEAYLARPRPGRSDPQAGR